MTPHEQRPAPDWNNYLVPCDRCRRIENERPVLAWVVLAGLTVAVIVSGFGLLSRLMTQ